MRLAQMHQNHHHGGPDTNKERDDEQQDLPLWNGHVPQETPVSTIRLDPNQVSTDDDAQGGAHTPLNQ